MKTLTDLQQITDVPVVIANHQGFVTYINSRFTEVLGWGEAEIIGELITKILPKNFQDSHTLAFSRFQATERATVLNHPIQLATVTKEHGEIETEHFIVAEKRGEQWLFGAMLTPIAESIA
ncbi:PAS domain-containing protein [Alkalinema sp. FACHB-956]|uniref:PAS domain-containing protein n=1 Tax=Alkalinema sp. FACHB-956 TaxID=2692768 RepID=UPI00168995B9|nr:PAS domain-containing protein [Alkalinema sp. FACHB-956]MBD2329760.1 PAS domain-containing protein [Alkalinema sp. FACHB-956]